jgi:predicted transcriptional regulator
MKRNKLEIIRDILKTINDNHNSIKITPLIRKSNLSTKRFNEYYKELALKRFIIERNNDKGKVIAITEKGKKYLERYFSIIGFIEEFDL